MRLIRQCACPAGLTNQVWATTESANQHERRGHERGQHTASLTPNLVILNWITAAESAYCIILSRADTRPGLGGFLKQQSSVLKDANSEMLLVNITPFSPPPPPTRLHATLQLSICRRRGETKEDCRLQLVVNSITYLPTASPDFVLLCSRPMWGH